MADQPNGTNSVSLKLWHIAILLLIQLGALAAGYGALRQEVSDLREREARIENANTISRDEFNAFRGDMQSRLDGIQQQLLLLIRKGR